MPVQQLHVLFTNDLHSRFETMPRISGAFRLMRARYGRDRVIAVDVGDHMDRMRPETEGTAGMSNIEVLNYMEYDVAVPGNNEGLTFDRDLLRRLYGEAAAFNPLCGNLLELDGMKRPAWLKPYVILERNGVRTGLIGLTAAFNDFYHSLGWHALPPLEAAATWVRELRPHVHLLIVLSHLGLSVDEQMARAIEGIDCIIGAHTHHLLIEPLYVNGTMISAAGKYGTHFGEAVFEVDTDRGVVVRREARCYETADFPEDDGLASLISRQAALAQTSLSERVAVLDRDLSNSWSQESELGNLLASGLRRWTGSDIGIVNAGQLLAPLSKGTVTRETILDICPSPINPCLMRLPGDVLLRTLEEALLDEMVEKPIMGFGFRGKVLGTLCVDGMDIIYDRDAPPYRKIRRVLVGGEPLSPRRWYRIGTIDMFTFGVGYRGFLEGKEIRYYLPELLRDVLIRQLQDREQLRASSRKRWLAN